MGVRIENFPSTGRLLVVLGFVPVALWVGRFIATDVTGAAGYFILLPLVVVLALPILKFGWENPEDYQRARRLFVLALLVRLTLTVVTNFAIGANTFAPDQVRYHYAGKFLAEQWGGQRVGSPSWFENPGNPYYYLVAILYYVFGSDMLLAKLVNVVAGALAVVGIFRITLRFGTPRAALLAGMFITFFPSLMLWSVLGIRDALVVLGLVLSFDAVLDWGERRKVSAWLMLAAGVFLVAWLRGYLANLLVASIALAALAGPGPTISPRRFIVSVSLMVLLVIGLRELGIIDPLVERVNLEGLDLARQNLAEGGSAFGEGADVGSLGSALIHLPVGISYFLLAPFPWNIESNLEFAALPEVFLWYALLPFVLIGIKHVIQEHGIRLSALLLFVTTVTLTYSLVEGNVGTAYRHRAQVLVFFLSFAAVGIDLFLRRRSMERTRFQESLRAPPPAASQTGVPVNRRRATHP